MLAVIAPEARMTAVALVRRASDLAALRVALSLGETVALAVAPDGEEPRGALSAARAAGAVRAVRLWDDSIGEIDYLGVATALAGALRKLGLPTAIVCGDGGSGAVGPALAERLALPHLGRVLDARIEGDKLLARRRGLRAIHKFAATPPAVLCVIDQAPPEAPKETNGGGEIEVWSLGDAQLSVAELSYRRSFRPQPASGPTPSPRRFADVAALVARLRDDGLV
jgi:electron transfer flavoprotein alpha/beta subunit